MEKGEGGGEWIMKRQAALLRSPVGGLAGLSAHTHYLVEEYHTNETPCDESVVIRTNSLDPVLLDEAASIEGNNDCEAETVLVDHEEDGEATLADDEEEGEVKLVEDDHPDGLE